MSVSKDNGMAITVKRGEFPAITQIGKGRERGISGEDSLPRRKHRHMK